MQDQNKSIAEQVAEYLRNAEDAEAKARAAKNALDKKSYEATAANWRRIAAFIDPDWKRS
jgi:hypothetical protein